MDNCLFCKIGRGEIPSEMVFENDHLFGIKDIHPQAPTHILLIPRKHIATLMDLEASDAGLIGEIHLAAQKLARDLDLAGSGFRMVQNCGSGAGQSVFHIHFHMLSGRVLQWPPG